MLLFLEIKREHFTIICPSPKSVTGCYCMSSFLLEQGQVLLVRLHLSQVEYSTAWTVPAASAPQWPCSWGRKEGAVGGMVVFWLPHSQMKWSFFPQ